MPAATTHFEQAKMQVEEKNLETLNRTIMQLKIKMGNNH